GVSRERVVFRPRRDGVAVGPVVDDRHARLVGALLLDEAPPHAIAERDDGVGLAQEKTIDAIQRAIHEVAVEVAEERRDLRKYVFAQEHEPCAGAARGPARRQAEDRRVGQRHDDVGAADVCSGERRGSEIGHVIGGASGKTSRREPRAVRAQDRDAVPRLAVDGGEATPIAARRVQRAARDDRDLAAVNVDQILGEFGQKLPRRRLIGPVGAVEEADLHAFWTAPTRCALYHAIVRVRPSRKPVDAVNPNASRARVTSSDRRGCPSGFVVSKVISPRKPVSSAMRCARSRMLISNPASMFTGSGPSYRSVASTMARAQSSTYRNSRVAQPVPQQTTVRAPASTASRNFLISAGMTCDDAGSKLSCGPYRLTGSRW